MAGAEQDVRARCVVEGGHLIPCTTLQQAFNMGVGHEGLHPLKIWSLSGASIVRSGAMIRSGKYARRGIVVNFCPFCGVDIGSHMIPDGATEDRPAADKEEKAS